MTEFRTVYLETDRIDVTEPGFPILGVVSITIAIGIAAVFYYTGIFVESEPWQKGMQVLTCGVILLAGVMSALAARLTANTIERRVAVCRSFFGFPVGKITLPFDEVVAVEYRTDVHSGINHENPRRQILRIVGPSGIILNMPVPESQRLWADEGDFSYLQFTAHVDALEICFNVLPGLHLAIRLAKMMDKPFLLYTAQHDSRAAFREAVRDAVAAAGSPEAAIDAVYSEIDRAVVEFGLREVDEQ